MKGISALAMLAALAAVPAGAETVKLTLLGVGDVYNFEEEDGRGGFARLNAVVKAERGKGGTAAEHRVARLTPSDRTDTISIRSSSRPSASSPPDSR